jgi:hypothetical protein
MGAVAAIYALAYGQDLLTLRTFQGAYERNGGHPLSREDIERFIEARELSVRLTSKGEAVLKR